MASDTARTEMDLWLARLAGPAQAAVEGMDRVYFWFAGAADHEFEHAEMLAAALGGA